MEMVMDTRMKSSLPSDGEGVRKQGFVLNPLYKVGCITHLLV